MITPEDYRIILKLESNPLISYSDLAEELGVSWPTAKRKVNDLKSRGVVRTPVAIYNRKTLDLHRVTIIWDLNNIKNLDLMEKFCDIHPFTHYRVRGYGDGYVLFAQFDIPRETIPLMKELIKILEQENYVDSSEFLQSSGYQVEAFPDLAFYDLEKNRWHFDWTEWLSIIKDQAETLPEQDPNKIRLEEWKPIDFNILRELTKNPSIKQAELMRLFNLTRTNVHLKYNLVFENLISKVRSRFDRVIFNLVHTRLFWVFNPNKNKMYQFYNLIKEAPPPFRFGLDILKDHGFLFWGSALPNIHEHQLAFSIWQLFQNFTTYTLDTSIDTSMIYWFYPQNFDFDTHYWKTDRAYFLEKPLEELSKVQRSS